MTIWHLFIISGGLFITFIVYACLVVGSRSERERHRYEQLSHPIKRASQTSHLALETSEELMSIKNE